MQTNFDALFLVQYQQSRNKCIKITPVPGASSMGTPTSSAGQVIFGRLDCGSFSTVLSSSTEESTVHRPSVSCSLASTLVTSVS